MSFNILLYGATGYTGRLIAREAKQQGMSETGGQYRMIVAARDSAALKRVALENEMEPRAFALDNPDRVLEGLEGVDVVLNAAGPFAFTAEPLVKAALERGCHCIDLNGEADVYRKLDDFGREAFLRKLALVSAAGNSAAASNILLDAALHELSRTLGAGVLKELGAIRIAVSQLVDFSRGSAETVIRSVREQVAVVRGQVDDSGSRVIERLRVFHEPVGKLERAFDFGVLPTDRPLRQGGGGWEPRRRLSPGPRTASAASLVDTLAARVTVGQDHKIFVHTIESYIQAGTLARMAYQVSGMLASVSALPWVRVLARAQLNFLFPDGPSEQEASREPHVVVLEIEDVHRLPVIDWRWQTPNVYPFTAQLAVAIARDVTKRSAPEHKIGWVTPAAALDLHGFASQKGLSPALALEHAKFAGGALRGCTLERRTG